MKFEEMITIYTIIHTSSETQNGQLSATKGKGSYQTLAAARSELKKQIAEEKQLIPDEYDCEEQGEDYWMRYQDGYAAAAFSRLEIVPAMLHYGECA